MKKTPQSNLPKGAQSMPTQIGLTPNQTFEMVRVWRQQIKTADYNPRLITEEAKANLRRSIKYFGLLEPLVLNTLTMTLVGGHQRLAELDILNNYPQQDYQIDCAGVKLSVEKEIEANLALNNPNLQGEFDYAQVAALGDQIDFSNAGWNKKDQDFFASLLFEQSIENLPVEDIIDTFEQMKQQNKDAKAQADPDDYLARKEAVQKIKQGTANKVKEASQYVTVILPNTSTKNALLAFFDKSPGDEYLSADELFEALGLDMDKQPQEEDTQPEEDPTVTE